MTTGIGSKVEKSPSLQSTVPRSFLNTRSSPAASESLRLTWTGHKSTCGMLSRLRSTSEKVPDHRWSPKLRVIVQNSFQAWSKAVASLVFDKLSFSRFISKGRHARIAGAVHCMAPTRVSALHVLIYSMFPGSKEGQSHAVEETVAKQTSFC